jgi:hypothetical protein
MEVRTAFLPGRTRPRSLFPVVASLHMSSGQGVLSEGIPRAVPLRSRLACRGKPQREGEYHGEGHL